MDVKVNIESSVVKDIENYCQNVAKFAAIRVRNELVLTMMSAIENFYADYTPKRYKRQGNLWNTFTGRYVNSHNKTYYGGIVLDPSLMENGIYNATPETVYNATLVYGFHGIPFNAPAITSPSPIDVILDRYDEICENMETYASLGEAEAKGESYRFLSFY